VAAQLLQGLLGPDTLVFYDSDPLRELIRCPSGSCADPLAEGFPRIRPPGLGLVYVASCFASSYLLWGPRRKRKPAVALLGVCMVGLLVSLNRNMLIGLTAGLLFTGLLASRRGRFAAAAAVVFVVALAGLELGKSSSTVRGNSIAARVLSLSATSELERSSTVSDRLAENDKALDALSRSPIEGIGWGASYGLTEIVWEDGEFRLITRSFIHNQFLGLWLRTGLVGLVAFVAALSLAVVSGARWMRRPEDEDAWIGAGVVTSITAIAVSSLVAIYMIHPSWAAILAGLMALGSNLAREAGEQA
jgi:O-antigen ligase